MAQIVFTAGFRKLYRRLARGGGCTIEAETMM